MKNNTQLSNKQEIISLIKSNLRKEKFNTQTEITKFLNDHGYYVSQSNISNYLRENNIRKNGKNYYEDTGLKTKKYVLRDLLIRSEATILEPRIYGNVLPEYECCDSSQLYVTFLCLSHGTENYICELLLDCYGVYSIFCQSGYGCIQIFSSSKNSIKSLYSSISKLCNTQD